MNEFGILLAAVGADGCVIRPGLGSASQPRPTPHAHVDRDSHPDSQGSGRQRHSADILKRETRRPGRYSMRQGTMDGLP